MSIEQLELVPMFDGYFFSTETELSIRQYIQLGIILVTTILLKIHWIIHTKFPFRSDVIFLWLKEVASSSVCLVKAVCVGSSNSLYK